MVTIKEMEKELTNLMEEHQKDCTDFTFFKTIVSDSNKLGTKKLRMAYLYNKNRDHLKGEGVSMSEDLQNYVFGG